MKSISILMTALLLLFSSAKTYANNEDMLMMHVDLDGPTVLEYVRSSVIKHGYAIAHEQRCDGGMSDFGYQTDMYRVVFFGKGKEVRWLSEKYPDIVSYVPLKMAVIAEKKETLVSIVNPMVLEPYYDREVRMQLTRWRNDILSIFDDIRREVAKRADNPLLKKAKQ